MLAGRTERRDVPHAEGEWIEFKTLSGLQMQRAADAKTERDTKAMAPVVAQWDDHTLARVQASEKKKTEKAPDYDAEMLIKWGINAWSLDTPCTDENKVLLDGPTLEWAVSVIVEMNTLPLVKSESSSLGENSHHDSATLPISSSTE